MTKILALLAACLMSNQACAQAENFPETNSGYGWLVAIDGQCKVVNEDVTVSGKCVDFETRGLVKTRAGQTIFGARAIAAGSEMLSLFKAAAEAAEHPAPATSVSFTLKLKGVERKQETISYEMDKELLIDGVDFSDITIDCPTTKQKLHVRRVDEISLTPKSFDAKTGQWELRIEHRSIRAEDAGPKSQYICKGALYLSTVNSEGRYVMHKPGVLQVVKLASGVTLELK